jgi:hypothetical protein
MTQRCLVPVISVRVELDDNQAWELLVFSSKGGGYDHEYLQPTESRE